jgi:hypothetical protein
MARAKGASSLRGQWRKKLNQKPFGTVSRLAKAEKGT